MSSGRALFAFAEALRGFARAPEGEDDEADAAAVVVAETVLLVRKYVRLKLGLDK